MLPLLSTSLLDTLKILMIGNVLTFANQMPVTFQDLMHEEDRYVSIDSIFMPALEPECLILKSIYPEAENCSSKFIQSHKVWNKGNSDYSAFVHLVKGYDVIYLQGNKIDNPMLYEIISSLDQIVDKDAAIILFQNYSTNLKDEEARRKELDKQLSYFQDHNKSDRVTLLSIGDLFNTLMGGDYPALIDESGLPTADGSDIIARALFEIVRPYIY